MADSKQDANNGPSQSRLILAKPRLGGFSSSSVGSTSSSISNIFGSGSVLRPPQFKSSGNNPFLRVSVDKDSEESKDDTDTDSIDDKLKETAKEEAETPIFVPLRSNVTARTNTTAAPANQPTTSSSSTGFVFGQNLSERVVFKESVNNGSLPDVDHSATNGTTELLFTNAIASTKGNNQDEPSTSNANSSKDLAAAAAEYERSHARPPPPPTNCTMTGEEGEMNVLQVSCRLFAWESGSWRERGAGTLRLNDAAEASGSGGGEGSRLVARVSGSLRVILNTKLWPEMVAERASAKSLRISAADSTMQIKLFLIMAPQNNISQLHKALLSRIAMCKKSSSANQSDKCHSTERLEGQSKETACFNKQQIPIDMQSDVYDDENGENISASVQIDKRLYANLNNREDKEALSPRGDNATERLTEDSLDGICEEKSDSMDSHIENSNEAKEESKSLKRKETHSDDETSTKRQCPKILVE